MNKQSTSLSKTRTTLSFVKCDLRNAVMSALINVTVLGGMVVSLSSLI